MSKQFGNADDCPNLFIRTKTTLNGKCDNKTHDHNTKTLTDNNISIAGGRCVVAIRNRWLKPRIEWTKSAARQPVAAESAAEQDTSLLCRWTISESLGGISRASG